MTSLKATGEPPVINPMSSDMIAEVIIAVVGIEVFVLTCKQLKSYVWNWELK
jgi:hypothetical protein